MAALDAQLDTVYEDYSEGYKKAMLGTIRRWQMHTIEVFNTKPWRCGWPNDPAGFEDQIMLYFVTEASLRFRNSGSVHAAMTRH